MFLRLIPTLVVVLPLLSPAQEDARKLKIDARKPIRLDYLAPSWNKDPKKIESSTMIIRDSASGRLAKVEMTETAPDTGLFTGVYRIDFKSGEKPELTPEIYLPPTEMATGTEFSKIESLIKEGTLLRKPYFIRGDRNSTLLSVFDSRAQALQAYETYLKATPAKPFLDPAALEAQKRAQFSAEEKARISANRINEQNRIRLEIEERQRQEELKQKQALLSAAEKERRKEEAKALGEQALKLYRQEKYKEAEEKFNQASELDPENTSFAFQYGVTLYRNAKYDRALVVLKLAKGENVNDNERQYYMALSHMKLKEYEQAHEIFTALKTKEDKVLSASSAFFAGVIDFQKEHYDAAKTNFEYVLDNSKDPKMDKQAEAYIEQIANIKRYEEMRKKKFILSANLGLMYDSNILSQDLAYSPTDLAGYRWSYGASLEYRPVFNEKHEFSAILSLSDMYSMDTGFKAKTEFQNTDPLVANFSLPFKWKGEALGKTAQLGITPAYETIMMNSDGSGSRETIVNSTILKGDGTFVMTDDHLAYYALEARRDTSLLTSTAANDQTANKITASTTQTFFQDKKKTTAILADAAIAANMANGDDQKYNRVDLAASYLNPGPWDSNVLSRLSLGYAQYPQHTTGRADTTYGLSFTMQKNITETMGAMGMLSYSKNNSTMDGNTYDKYLIMTGLNWKTSF